MIRATRRGDVSSGRGFGHVPLLLVDAAAPRIVAPGGDGTFLDEDTLLFAGPTSAGWRIQQARRSTNWTPEAFAPAGAFAPTNLKAAAGRWMATRVDEATRALVAIGTIPGQYAAGWDCHDLGPDGTIVCVRNGIFDVCWPDGAITVGLRAPQLRAADGVLVCVDDDGRIRLRYQNGSIVEPAQLAGVEYHVYVVVDRIGRAWLIYLAPGYGLVCHLASDATQGYQWPDLIPSSPIGVTLDDDRTVLVCALGDGEQAGDLWRVFVALGIGLQPLREAPIPAPRSARRVWRGYSNAYATDPGNMTQGWYPDDPRPTIEGATFLEADALAAHPAKLLAVHWSPHEAPGERGAAIAAAKQFGVPISLYCDRPRLTDLCRTALRELRAAGVDAFLELQAYPSADDFNDADAAVARITEDLVALERAGETRIGLRRIGRYGTWPVATVEAMQQPLTDLVDAHPAIVTDVAFEARHGRTPRLIEYVAAVCAAMPAGTPPRLAAPAPPAPVPVPPTPQPEPPAPPAEPEDDVQIPLDKKFAIIDALADAVHVHFPHIPRGTNPFIGPGTPGGAWQGILQMWDALTGNVSVEIDGVKRIPAPSLSTMAFGAILRLGTGPNGADPLKIDALMADVIRVEAVFLRR